jgi:hypothetical protein
VTPDVTAACYHPRIIVREAKMERIADAVAGVRLGEGAVYKNMTLFPLCGEGVRAAGYVTLDEALERQEAEVTEVSEGGSVPELKFVNSGRFPVFLLDGEELIGAKQNRVLNLSILVAAGRTVLVPVSCVEAGRWHRRSRKFCAAPRAQYAAGRARKMDQVSRSMSQRGQRRSDQGAVWADISEMSARFGVSSETSAMSDIFDREAARLEDYVEAFPVLDGQRGAVFAVAGRVVGVDLFDSAETFRKLFPKLLRSYGLDALDRARSESPGKGCSREEAGDFLRRVASAEVGEFPAVGEGTDLRLQAGGLTGAALAAGDRILHLGAFNLGADHGFC